jgi:peptidoglycan hydrolase-like protein with peptidoglycan-binding domain
VAAAVAASAVVLVLGSTTSAAGATSGGVPDDGLPAVIDAEGTAGVDAVAGDVLAGDVVSDPAGGSTGSGGVDGGAAPQPVPPTPAGLPSAIEAPAAYVKQSSCDPAAKPGAAALAALLTRTYPGTSAGIGRGCGADGIASEHYEGRAVDWMVGGYTTEGRARATALLGWLLAPDAAGDGFANARRTGVMYLIWDGKIWGSYQADAGWRPYSGCAAHPERSWDTSCHRDHVHVSLSWAGAMRRTSYWTQQVAAADYGPCRPVDLNWAPPYSEPNPTPCRTYATVMAVGSSPLARWSGATVRLGSTGPVVSAVQTALGLTADAQFGPVTAAALSAWRVGHGLSAGTVMDAAAWRAMLAAQRAAAASTPPSGTPSGTSSGGSTSATPAAPAGLGSYPGRPLASGASGAAVAAVQRVLGLTADARFGPLTRSAVSAFQTRRGLAVTGVVDAATWAALASATR